MTLLHTDTEARNLALVSSAFEAWRDGRGSPFELLDVAASWTIVGRSDVSKTYLTRESFLREVIDPFNARMGQPLTPSVPRLYADGNTIISRFEAEGVALDGEAYANTYAWFMEMRDDKIVRAYAFFDSVAFNDLWRRVVP